MRFGILSNVKVASIIVILIEWLWRNRQPNSVANKYEIYRFTLSHSIIDEIELREMYLLPIDWKEFSSNWKLIHLQFMILCFGLVSTLYMTWWKLCELFKNESNVEVKTSSQYQFICRKWIHSNNYQKKQYMCEFCVCPNMILIITYFELLAVLCCEFNWNSSCRYCGLRGVNCKYILFPVTGIPVSVSRRFCC